MAVYTEVTIDEAQLLFNHLELGAIQSLTGCKGGIENTNYFVNTKKDGHPHEFVLTLFERLNFEELPFYLKLMKHLAREGIPVPDPSPDVRGELMHCLKDKPTAVVNKLSGASELQPDTNHCAEVGTMLARMHIAAKNFPIAQKNLRDLQWCTETARVVLPYLNTEQNRLLQSEIAYQNHISKCSAYQALPRGPVHADLFRDNVMFEKKNGVSALSGIFDFYFAGVDTWLFDLAVAMNDWSIDPNTGQEDPSRAQSFLKAYTNVRTLSKAERELFPAMLRAGALRFWLSRLWDFHLPRQASILTAHDPNHFERVLNARIHQPVMNLPHASS